jgi:hypothetical protein
MTFTALSQSLALLLIIVAAAAAAAVFAIRPRPQRQAIASLTIWQRVLGDARERSFWDRVRWIVSLVLTAVIAAAIAIAVTRPVPRTAVSSSGRALIVLDSSWSMRARTPSGVTRWDRAIQEARAIADASGFSEIALATTAEGLIEGPTSDRALVRSALDRLAPSGAIDGAWPRIAGAGPVHFVTDGAVARATDADVIVHSVFTPAPNVALVAFDVHPASTAGAEAEVFIAVANYAPVPQTVQLTVSRAASVIIERSLEIRAGEIHREVIGVPSAGDARFRAQVNARDNALEIDDDAVGWLWTAQPLQVGVVGASSVLPALLARDASLRVSTVEPAGYAQARADVWVFDRWLPPAAPASPALIIDPPASSWLGPRGAVETRPIWRSGTSHPILDGLDASLLRAGSVRAFDRAALLPIAVSERNTLLVGVEDSASGRYVVLGFSTADSNVASTSALPILAGNAIEWLGRPERGMRRQPGPFLLPAMTQRVIAPNGQSLPLVRSADRVTTILPAPGLYLVESAGAQSVISVGLGDLRRSNLLVSSVVQDRSVRPEPRAPGRPVWTYAALAALALAVFEWVTWRRRITV